MPSQSVQSPRDALVRTHEEDQLGRFRQGVRVVGKRGHGERVGCKGVQAELWGQEAQEEVLSGLPGGGDCGDGDA